LGTAKRFHAKNGVDNNSQTIINVATPVNNTDAANKSYADTKLALTGGTLTGSSSGNTLELLALSNTGSGANTKARLNFYSTSTSYGSIAGGYGASAPEMVFDLPSGTPGNYIWRITGAEKMRLDTSGNLGIGTASPGAKLDVAGDQRLSLSANQTRSLSFYNTTNSTVYGRIQYVDTTGVFDVSNQGAYPLTFSTSATERMRIDSSGNVGIGNTSPATKLHVIGAITGQSNDNYFGDYSSGAYIDVGNLATSEVWLDTRSASLTNVPLNLRTKGSGEIKFTVGTTERLRITAGGNIHTPAGTTTMTNGFIYIPAAAGAPTGAATAITGTVPLYYNSSANTLHAYNSTWQTISGGGLSLISTNANGIVYLNGSSQATTSTALVFNGTEFCVGGNPSSGIQIEATTTTLAQIRARATTNGVDSRLSSSSTGLVGYVGTVSNHPFAFYANNTEYMRLTSTGALQIRPNGGEGGEIQLYNPDNTTIGGYLDVSVADNLRLWTGTNNATMQIGQLTGTGGNIQFFTATSEKVRITSAGDVGIGISSPLAKLHVNGGNIFISSASAAGGVFNIIRNTDATAASSGGIALWNDQNPFAGYNASILMYSNASTVPNEVRVANAAAAPITFYASATLGTPVEKVRVTTDGGLIIPQPAQGTQNTSATLTIAQIKTGIITSNAAVTLTLPTGTTLDTYTTAMAVDTAFEVVFIATTASAITIGANGNTTVGNLTVAGNTSGRYRFRKTAANTFTVYRV
jgi:hypothetical protein